MTVYICPITSLQFTVSSDTSKEASVLWPHPSSKNLETILTIENKLKRLHGALVYYKILSPIKDLSEVQKRNRLISAIQMNHSDMEQLIKKLRVKSSPGINTDNPKDLERHLQKIINSEFEPILTFEVNIEKEKQSYTNQKRDVKQVLRCLKGLCKEKEFLYLACPQNREHAKKLALSINHTVYQDQDRVKKIRMLLIELSDNKAFNDTRTQQQSIEEMF